MTHDDRALDADEASLGDPSDSDLVLRTRSGDGAAFGELWRRHYRSGITVARSITSSLDPDDLVQEAYARIYQSILKGGGPTGAFRAYLFTTIRNTAASWGRARKETALDVLESFEDPETSAEATDDALDRSITAQAFRSLPTRWQEVLWYTEIEGMKPSEVAPLLGMKAAAVAQLAFRAREGLREAWIQAHLRSVADGSECQWTIERLGAYARENLSRRDQGKVEAHLTDCARCTIVAAEAQEVSRRLALVLLPLTIGVSGTAGYLAWLQGGGAPIVAVAAMPSSIVPGAVLAPVAAGGATTGAGSASASAGSAGDGAGGSSLGVGAVIGLVAAGVLVAGTIAAAALVPGLLGSAHSSTAAADAPASQQLPDVVVSAPPATTETTDTPTTPLAPVVAPKSTEPSPAPKRAAEPRTPADSQPAAPAVTPTPSPEPTQPGTTDPVTPEPQPTDPGTPEPEPEPTDPGTPEPEPTDPGTPDPGPSNPEPTDPGTTQPGTPALPSGSPSVSRVSTSRGADALTVRVVVAGPVGATVVATLDGADRASTVIGDGGTGTLTVSVSPREYLTSILRVVYVAGDERGTPSRGHTPAVWDLLR